MMNACVLNDATGAFSVLAKSSHFVNKGKVLEKTCSKFGDPTPPGFESRAGRRPCSGFYRHCGTWDIPLAHAL